MIAAALVAGDTWRYAEIARDLGVEVRREEPLAHHTTMRVGGPAAWFYLPRTETAAAQLWRALADGPLPVRALGAGSNLVVVDAGVRAAVVATSALAPEPQLVEPTLVRCGAGQPVPGLVRFAAKLGLAGIEFAEGIPAQLGGAIRMNAGANQSWFGDVTESVLLAGPDGHVVTHETAPKDFGYRQSFVGRQQLFVVGAELRLRQDDPEAIAARIKAYRERRRRTQPLQDRSAGCVFANYESAPVGKLVDELGLKGARIGGAEVSTLHGNFIVNKDGASAADVLALVDRVREALTRATGEAPRIEVEIWRDEP